MVSMIAAYSRYTFPILLFLYIYNIGFFFFPGPLKTRMIVGIMGLFFYLSHHTMQRRVYIILSFLLSFILFALITVIINQACDFWFIQYIVLNSLYLLGAVFLFDYYKNKYQNVEQFLGTIVQIILVHNLVAFSAMFFPVFQQFIVSIQKLSASELIEAMLGNGSRSIGFGDGNFFHGGVLSGVGLIMTMYLYKVKYMSWRKCLLYYIVILFTGIFIARTTMVGLISFLFVLVGNKKERVRSLLMALLLSFILGIVILLVVFVLKDVLNIGWAFEMFITYFERGTVETASTNHLETMVRFPDDIKTWFIGDALFYDSTGAYYMHTDIGHIRLLYYGGIFGSLLFWIFQFYLCRTVYDYSKKNSHILSLIIVLFIYVLALNMKGFIDLNFIFFLILSYFSYNFKKV